MRIYGLIGYPLGHSFSAKYFAERFEKYGISDSRYVNFPIEDISGLPELILKNRDLVGLNVTIPHKESVIPFLDEMDPLAERIGAVNTIKVNRSDEGFVLKGYNTDIYGFRESLRKITTGHARSALVLGTGGASKAVFEGLKEMNIDPLSVSRSKNKADLTYSDLDQDIMSNNLLIVNTTPLGTFPDVSSCPALPYEYLSKNHILYDLVYNPPETLFLKKGREQGCTTLNGYQMLVLQAEKSWEIWNDN